LILSFRIEGLQFQQPGPSGGTGGKKPHFTVKVESGASLPFFGAEGTDEGVVEAIYKSKGFFGGLQLPAKNIQEILKVEQRLVESLEAKLIYVSLFLAYSLVQKFQYSFCSAKCKTVTFRMPVRNFGPPKFRSEISDRRAKRHRLALPRTFFLLFLSLFTNRGSARR
jgi:hypothetical protein